MARFQKGHPGGPGRPKRGPEERAAEHARRRETLALREAMDKLASSALDVANATVAKALNGDTAAMKLVLDRVAPPPPHEGSVLKIAGFNPRDPERAADLVLDAMARGELSPERAQLIIGVLRARTEIAVNADTTMRLQRVMRLIEERKALPGALSSALHVDLISR